MNKKHVKVVEIKNEDSRIVKMRDYGYIEGVCAGISEYFSIDVAFLRILFVLSSFCYGYGILIYILLMILLPSSKNDERDFWGNSKY